MKRDEVIREIVKLLDDEIVVCNLGHPSQELYLAGDRHQNFYMLGSMGMALPIGLGLALSQPRKVIVLEGDGSLLMNLGSLSTLATAQPNNLLLVILDNGSYGSTGYQPTATSSVANLAAIARASGNPSVETVAEKELSRKVRSSLESGLPRILHIPVEKGHASMKPIPLEPEQIKHRFMKAIRQGP